MNPLRALRYAWASPATLLGAALPAPLRFGAITFGHVIHRFEREAFAKERR